jgi:hypothetical protein
MTFALNYAAGGHRPWGYHLVNIAIDALAAITLYGLARQSLLRGRQRRRPHRRWRWSSRHSGPPIPSAARR